MMIAAFVTLVAVGVGGDLMAYYVVAKKPIPSGFAQGHLVGAVIGLVLLVLGILTGARSTAAWLALLIFASGFAGGWVLFRVLFARQRPPIWAVAVHGTIGWIGVVALWFAL